MKDDMNDKVHDVMNVINRYTFNLGARPTMWDVLVHVHGKIPYVSNSNISNIMDDFRNKGPRLTYSLQYADLFELAKSTMETMSYRNEEQRKQFAIEQWNGMKNFLLRAAPYYRLLMNSTSTGVVLCVVASLIFGLFTRYHHGMLDGGSEVFVFCLCIFLLNIVIINACHAIILGIVSRFVSKMIVQYTVFLSVMGFLGGHEKMAEIVDLERSELN